MTPIKFNEHVLAPNELRYVEESLKSGVIGADGPFTARATTLLEEHFPGASVLITTSCTHALELCALLHDIGPKDEVVMPSFTFTSTANAITLRGARIRFADISPDTLCMDLSELERAVTPNTTAVVAMHYAGVGKDIGSIRDFCSTRGLKLIEDNAQGLFATHRSKPLGTFAPLTAISFHVTKNIGAGIAGALIINDPTFMDRALVLREKGTNRAAFLRGAVDKYTWRGIGSAYAPADYVAAVLSAQLEHRTEIQARRHAVVATYRSILAPVAESLGITLQVVPDHCQSPAHIFAVCLPAHMDREHILATMQQQGIQCTSHYEPLHLSPVISERVSLPISERVARSIVRLPLHAALSDNDAVRVAEALRGQLENAGT
jgi:dTDP-4-amino-4,6-dideoxygalactose transaminase